MEKKYSIDFVESFYDNPMPVYLFGADGIINIFVAYKKILGNYGIIPKALVSAKGGERNIL